MEETIDNILSENKSVDSWEVVQEGWCFKLKGINTAVLIRLCINPVRGGFNYWNSHRIHTPSQTGPYAPSRPWGDGKDYAFSQALSAITTYYAQAVKEGHTPGETWLMPI